LRDTYLGGQNVSLNEYINALNGLDLVTVPDEDVVKLALYFVLERFFMGREKRRIINLGWLDMVDDLDQFNAYPWGDVVYAATIDSLETALKGRLAQFQKRRQKKPSHEVEKYNLAGCPTVFQVIQLYLLDCSVLQIRKFKYL
jgi:hypothetical protein